MSLYSEVYISMGSNMGDRLENLKRAVGLVNILAAVPLTIQFAKVYETAAWGKTDQAAFLNTVIRFSTVHAPESLLNQLLQAEKLLGRVREEKWGPRIIDLDILYYNDAVVQFGETLLIPHPGIALRRFVLQPLNDLAPDFVHPVLKKTNRELLAACADQLPVHIFTGKLF